MSPALSHARWSGLVRVCIRSLEPVGAQQRHEDEINSALVGHFVGRAQKAFFDKTVHPIYVARSRIIGQNVEPKPVGAGFREYPPDNHAQKSAPYALTGDRHSDALEAYVAMGIIEVTDNSE
jgi:hypothetical protein